MYERSISPDIHYVGDMKKDHRALFFNLEPGKYVVAVKTYDDYLLALDTLIIYSDTLSVARMGSLYKSYFTSRK